MPCFIILHLITRTKITFIIFFLDKSITNSIFKDRIYLCLIYDCSSLYDDELEKKKKVVLEGS